MKYQVVMWMLIVAAVGQKVVRDEMGNIVEGTGNVWKGMDN